MATSPTDPEPRRRAAVRTAWLAGLVAAGVYVGFMALAAFGSR